MAPSSSRGRAGTHGMTHRLARSLRALARLRRRIFDRFTATSKDPEPPDVATGRILLIVAGWAVFFVVSVGGLGWYTLEVVPLNSSAQDVHALPSPALQVAAPRDLDQLFAAQRRRLETYAWSDRDRGLVQIPIDRAMAIIAARGTNAFAPLVSVTPDSARTRAVGAATQSNGGSR